MIITKHKYVATKPDHSHTFAYGNCIAHYKTLEFVDGGRVAPTLLYSFFAFFFKHEFGGDIHPKQIRHISNDIDVSGWDIPNRYYK